MRKTNTNQAISTPTLPARYPVRQVVMASILALGGATPLTTSAALWDLATAPLETSGAASVKPNIFFILDDSGSMNWDFMPDWANDTCDSNGRNCTESLTKNAGYNQTYYNPAITYAPPLNYNGTSKTSMNRANTVAWTKVPFDAYGIQSAGSNKNTGTDNIIVFPNSSDGSTWQNLVGSAQYYKFTPGAYCTAPNLRTCNVQSAPNATYPYPANLQWCNSSALTTCQATRIDGSYTYPKYPGQDAVAAQGATSTLTVTNANNTRTKQVSNITVNGNEILAAAQSDTDAWDLVNKIADSINSCTSAITGNCTVAGYSAVADYYRDWWGNYTYFITLTAPSSLGNITYTPVVTDNSRIDLVATAFSGGRNASAGTGSNTLVSITSGNTYARASTRSDCQADPCTYDEEMTNFANWWAYYHTRMQMAKSAISTAFASLDSRYRLGYMSINNSTSTGNDFLNISDITTTSGGQKDLWFQKIANANPTGGTSLRSALSTAGRIYGGKLTGSQELWGRDGGTVTVADPMQYSCQRNFTLLSTDGYWNAGSSNGLKLDGTAVGDQDSTETGAALDGNSASNTLADVAEYYYKTDIRSSTFSNTTNTAGTDVSSNDVADKQQRMYTSTVGLGASGYMLYQSNYATATSGDFYDVKRGTSTSTTTAAAGTCSWQTSGNCTWPSPTGDTQTTIDDLWHTAVNGRGTYYSAKDPASLQNSLADFLSTVTASTASSSAATTSNPNVSTGDNYVFKSTFRSGQWYGELARYSLDVSTGTLSANADWSQSGTVYSNATTQTYSTPLLDNRTYTDRTIYTYNPAATTAGTKLVAFTPTGLSDAGLMSYFQISTISSGSAPLGPLSQLCTSGSNCLASTAQVDSTTAGTTTGAGGVNLVNYLRGDRSNEGTDNGYYFQRTHVLGDIVDSQAVYVRVPLWSYLDTGYTTFKSDNASRLGVVYVGANDGMLHAFNASTGAELWAYVPSLVLPNMYKLADKRYASNHAFFVNATPKTGDVYFPGTSGAAGTWKTILVSGLGRGGRGYFALDITNPSSPAFLWEFKASASSQTGYITDPDLGYTYGTPIITKLSDGTWVVIVTSGYNNVNPGSGHGVIWVLNAQTGAIIKKIDTGMGTNDSSTTITGCSTGPCPSGLSKISAYVDNSRTNNWSKYVYGGDLYGNVWRVDLTALTASGGDAPVQLLATLSADANGTQRQPVTTRPEVSYINNKPVVYIGTGSYLGATDVSDTRTQTIYALKDPLTTTTASTSTAIYSNPRSSTCTASTKTACFVKNTLTDSSGVRTATSTVSYSVDFATMNGWFADMPLTGERIDTDPDLQLGTLAFTSNKPSTNDPCSSGGSSFLNYFNYKTGLAVTGYSNVGVALSSGATNALSTAVTLVRLPTGKVVGVTNLSDGSSITKQTPAASSATGTRRVMWRELIN